MQGASVCKAGKKVCVKTNVLSLNVVVSGSMPPLLRLVKLAVSSHSSYRNTSFLMALHTKLLAGFFHAPTDSQTTYPTTYPNSHSDTNSPRLQTSNSPRLQTSIILGLNTDQNDTTVYLTQFNYPPGYKSHSMAQCSQEVCTAHGYIITITTLLM